MNRICKVILAAAAVAAFATPAMAAEKLIVKDSTGSSTVFSVDDTGRTGVGSAISATTRMKITEPVTGDISIMEAYSGAVLRHKLRGLGLPIWYMNSGSAEVGRISYSTPAGYPGIVFYTGATYDQNRFNLANLGGGAANATGFKLYPGADPNAATGLTIATATGNVGISADVPTQKLEVNGGVRLNTATARPACDATSRGTLWFTQGATDGLAICATTGSGSGWKTITLP